jgi:hypothetical protein
MGNRKYHWCINSPVRTHLLAVALVKLKPSEPTEQNKVSTKFPYTECQKSTIPMMYSTRLLYIPTICISCTKKLVSRVPDFNSGIASYMLGWVSTMYQCITSFLEGPVASVEQRLVGSSALRRQVAGHPGTLVAGMKLAGI